MPTKRVRFPGSISVDQNKTGLTSGTSYEFRLMLRNDAYRSTDVRSYSGVASVAKG